MAIKLLASALAAALVLTATPQAQAADTPLSLSLLRGGAVAADPVVAGDRVYIPTGRVIATWDYSDPAAPLRVATSGPADAAINGLALHGNQLYASWRGYDGSSGVAVYSLADPAQPELVGQTEDYVAADNKFLLGLAIANDHLYLFDNNHGVFVSDLADPAAPQFAATGITGVPTQYSRIIASGSTIYGTGRNWLGGTVLDIYDASNPELPTQVAGNGVDGLDNFSLAPEPGFVLGTGNQLTLYDLNASGQLSKRGWLDIPPAITGVRVGDYAYSFGWGQGLDAWNIADIDAPVEAGHFDIDAFAGRRVVRSGNLLLIPTDTDLLQAVDVSTPQTPTRVSTSWLPVGIAARDIAMHGGSAVLVQPNYGLTVNDPQTLAPTARFEVDLPKKLESRSFEAIAMSGDIAWLASWGYGLVGVDLSDPAAPVEAGRMAFPFAAVLDVAGQYAYVAKWTNGGLFGVADISNPAAPTLVWQGGLSNQPYALKVDGSHAYMAESNESNTTADGGLRVFDLADPAAPVEVSHLNADCGNGYDLAIDSAVSLLYLACGTGVQVIDIADPAAPAVVGRFNAEDNGQYTRVALHGDRAWFADNAGVHELDITDPTQPTQVKLTPLGHQGAQRLYATDDDRLFALGGNTGVHVFTAGEAPEATPLENKVPVTALSGAAGEELLFAIEVPAGARMLNILSYGGSGDITLLAKRNGVPTEGDADGRSSRPGNSETIRITNPAPGTYYIKVVGVKAFSRLTLQARY
ncbi:pre-peptidase C-terminal domain-containing protein [Luteimonas sp. 22616]|uniref:pre-peptidase C-terminal domain-containing protein n=1 Tax=Luteimonas sp. 22616 TaxID=3453951 RepID=UPI003F82CEFE